MADPQAAPAVDDDDRNDFIDPETGAMRADHPMMLKAQEALKKQLLSAKQRLEDDLREKRNALKAAKESRERVGVDLYGFQRNLAKLQEALEEAQQNYATIAAVRQQAEQQLEQMREALEDELQLTKQDRSNVQDKQQKLDSLASSLKQIEKYNEQMNSEIAVKRREAYATEEAVQKLEKEKMEQDFLIDGLQETLKSLQGQLELYQEQLTNQKRETRSAQETLAEAESEMQAVHFEKKQLLAQWQSSITAVKRRDEALAKIESLMRQQIEQELNIENELEGYKKDIVKEQLKNEQLTSMLKKAEGESEFLRKQVDGLVEKQDRLQELLAKLQKSLELTESQLARTNADIKVAGKEQEVVDRAAQKVGAEIRQLEDEMLEALNQQTTAEKSSAKTTSDIRAARKKVRDEELAVAEMQNELARLQVEVVNTEAANDRLKDTLALVEQELKENEKTIERFELEIKRRHDDIERKTSAMDLLNKEYDRLQAASKYDPSTGPLEATIHHLQKEIDQKGMEGKDLQRRWITNQTELVRLQNDNQALSEALQRLRAENTILTQKRRRLEAQFEHTQADIKALSTNMTHLHHDIQRINALISQNSQLRTILQEDNFNLEQRILGELKELELESARLSTSISDQRNAKRDLLAEIVEVEKQILLWERKITLEKEMQAALDATDGEVIGAMKKEIQRMEQRHAELRRLQEKLMVELEKAISKREVIGVKSEVAEQRRKVPGADAALRKDISTLQKNLKDADKQMAATESNIGALGQRKAELAQQLMQTDVSCQLLRQQEEQLKVALDSKSHEKYKVFLATTRQQRTAKRLEEVEAGRYRPLVEEPAALDGELARAQDKQRRIVGLLDQLKAQVPELTAELDRILCHVATV